MNRRNLEVLRYEQGARVGKPLASPKRLEMLAQLADRTAEADGAPVF